MRYLVIGLCLFAVGCAAPPQSGRYALSGNTLPAGAHIASDGVFSAGASAWTMAEVDLARQTAIHKLQIAAMDRGYTTYELDEMNVVEGPGVLVSMTGRLYLPGEGPQTASPISAMSSGVIAVETFGESDDVTPIALGPEEKKKPLRVASAGTEPVVIEAPEFLEE